MDHLSSMLPNRNPIGYEIKQIRGIHTGQVTAIPSLKEHLLHARDIYRPSIDSITAPANPITPPQVHPLVEHTHVSNTQRHTLHI